MARASYQFIATASTVQYLDVPVVWSGYRLDWISMIGHYRILNHITNFNPIQSHMLIGSSSHLIHILVHDGTCIWIRWVIITYNHSDLIFSHCILDITWPEVKKQAEAEGLDKIFVEARSQAVVDGFTIVHLWIVIVFGIYVCVYIYARYNV